MATGALAIGPLASGAQSHPVNQTWQIHQVSNGGGVTIDAGTVTGTPFGSGTVMSRAQAAGSAIVSTFTERFAQGTVKGRITIAFTFVGAGTVRYSGHGSFTGGTGIYSNASGSIRTFTGTGTAAGRRATIRVTGTAIYQAAAPPPKGTATGTVLVDGRQFTNGTIPYGSTVDVTSGSVSLTTDAGTLTVYGDGTSPAKAVLERSSERVKSKTLPLVQLTLVGGDFKACGTRKALARVPNAPKPKPKKVRALWGRGKGHFRTRGRYSSATVRGTNWLTVDRCDGTLTQVATGTVSVIDFTLKKTVSVGAGKTYLAPVHR
jgi:hypothetical protein